MTKSLRAKPIVERADDLLVNGNLRLCRNSLRGWNVCFHEAPDQVLRSSPAGTVIDRTGGGYVEISQSIRAWANVRYRLDVHVEPLGGSTKRALAGKPPVAQDGLSGSIQVCFTSLRKGEEIRTYEPPTMRIGNGSAPIHRAIVQCPPGTGRLQVRLRFQASQPIVVKRIRLVETGAYLMTSHVLANPPLPSCEPPPYVPEGVLLCDGRKDDRPLLKWLSKTFGADRVQRVGRADLVRVLKSTQDQAPCQQHGRKQRSHSTPSSRGAAQAIVVDLPEDCRLELEDLLAASDRAIIIVSLGTFAGAASRAGIKDIRIQDRVSGLDMPCGEITEAGYFTHGFALGDGMPYAWNDGQDDFAHRYLVMPKPTRTQLAGMGIRPAIVTECGHREYYNHPLVLHRAGQHGSLLVMDPDGLEQPSAGDDVPRIFDLLWRSALGQPTVQLGQFSAPPTHYEGMLVDLVEVAKHYDLIEDVSILTRIRGKGNWPPAWLLPGRRSDPFARHPALHIRTGFVEADWPAVYALILWLKRLALAAARNEPAGRNVLQRVRVLAWPIAEPQQWRGCPKDVTAPRSNLAPEDVAGQIDLQVGVEPQVVILVPDRDTQTTVRQALRPISGSIATGATGYSSISVGALQSASGKDVTDIRVSAEAFGDQGAVARAGQLRCKVLLPGVPQPTPAGSPWLTDVATDLLQRLALMVAARAPGC